MERDDDRAWAEVAERGARGRLPLREDNRPRAIQLALPSSARRSAELLGWYASVRSQQSEDDGDARSLGQHLLSHIVACGDDDSLTEMRRMQREEAFPGARWLGFSAEELEDRLLDESIQGLDAGDVLDVVIVPARRIVRNDWDLTNAIVAALKEIQEELRRGEGVPAYWNEPGATGGAYAPKSEEGCQNALWPRLRDKLRGYRVMATEEERFVGPKRVDFAVDAETVGGATARVVVEAKVARDRYGPAKLVRPVREQLVDRYMKPLGVSEGIYLVFWFKGSKGVDYPKGWASAEALKRTLSAEADRLPDADGIHVTPVVLDVSASWRER